MRSEEICKLLEEISLVCFSLGKLALVKLVAALIGFCVAFVDHHIVFVHTVVVFKIIVGIVLLQHIKSPVFAIQINNAWA